MGLRCAARAAATACSRELDSGELVAGAAVGKLYRDEAKLVGWLARGEEGRERVLRGELSVEVRGAVRAARRQPAASACGDGICARVEEARHGRGSSGVARLVASTTMAAHARARGEGESERGAVVDLIMKASLQFGRLPKEYLDPIVHY